MTVMKRVVGVVAMSMLLAGCAHAGTLAEQGEPLISLGLPPDDPTLSADLLPRDNRPVWKGFEATRPEPVSLVAMANGETTIYETPTERASTETLPWTTILGTVSVYSVVGEPADGWAEVLLPVRPNGTTGWVRTDDVTLYAVGGRIIIDLSEKELVYLIDDREVLRSTVAVGTSQNPTPTGTFYVTDSVTMSYSGSPWGPHALGLSARSDTITEYNGGDGIIGIHGTNRPSSIGKAASLGCVRLPNDLITALHELVPIGTPVEIKT